MGMLLSADWSTGSAEPVEEQAARVRATGAGVRSLVARWLSLSGAAFSGKQRGPSMRWCSQEAARPG